MQLELLFTMIQRIFSVVGHCFLAANFLLYASQQLRASEALPVNSLPNFVVLFADDMGYGDVGCFDAPHAVTPYLDQMARSGMRLTSFYVSQAVCSASRSSLLTGCYNGRIGIQGALGPGAKICLNPDEMTIAKCLQQVGYATAVFGKWHLGDRGVGNPLNHGFDEYHGLPYSNDMWPFHPTAKHFPPLPLLKGLSVVNSNVTAQDQRYLTRWSTEHAVDFIRRHQEQPFLLYVPYSMPHVPIFASEAFEGATGKGLYADVIAEIDWSVGQILATLDDLKLRDDTMVLFTSDNGPWLSYGNHAGSAGPLREGKGTTWEGGVRVPTIVSWPNKIPAGSVCDEVAGTIDLLPTFAALSGAALPTNKIDGKDIWPLLSGKSDAISPHAAWYYYWQTELHAVRSGDWKLVFPHSYRTLGEPPGRDGSPSLYVQRTCGLELYDLKQDIGEQSNVADENAEIVQRLQELANSIRSELGDSLTGVTGHENRQPGSLP